MTKWIQNINSPADLKKIPLEKLPEVAEEYRQFMIEAVAKTGGHLGASLGTLEITLALHYVLNSPNDKICWDVGHQAYTHKMITGRREQMATLRQPGGLSGFPCPGRANTILLLWGTLVLRSHKLWVLPVPVISKTGTKRLLHLWGTGP